MKVCCGPRRKKREDTTTITTTTTTTATTTINTTKKSLKTPCKSKLDTAVASVSNLVLYGNEPEELNEDCIRNPDAEENNHCKSVADVVVPYTFGNCTGIGNENFQPQCGRHNEVFSLYIQFLMRKLFFQDGYNLKMVNMDPTKHESQFGEWPNMCAVLKRLVVSDYPVTVYGGGASLITSR